MTRMNLCILALLAMLSKAMEQCPPTTGVYIMQGAECIADNSFVRAKSVIGVDKALKCLLANSSNSDSQWLYPNGTEIDCTTSSMAPLICAHTGMTNALSLYLNSSAAANMTTDGEYTCRAAGSSEQTRVRIFDTEFIQDLSVDLPNNITTVPQAYFVHCNVGVSFGSGNFSLRYNLYDQPVDGLANWCNANDHLECSKSPSQADFSSSVNSTLNVTWYASTVITSSSEISEKNASNGDHEIRCSTNTSTTSEQAYIRIRAPNFPSSTNPFTFNVEEITATTASISWVPLYPTDTDGYIIYYHKMYSNDLNNIQLITDNNSSGCVLMELDPSTNYSVIIRAFQDILGPPTEEVFFTTDDWEEGSGISLLTSIDALTTSSLFFDLVSSQPSVDIASSSMVLLPFDDIMSSSVSESSLFLGDVTISSSSTVTVSIPKVIISETPIPMTTSSPSPSPAIEETSLPWLYPVVGAAAAALGLLLSSLVCCLLISAAKKRKRTKDDQKKQLLEMYNRPDPHFIPAYIPLPQHRQLRPQRISYISKAHHVLSSHSHLLPITELGRAALDIPTLHTEYMAVPANMVTMNEVPTGAEEKNRYGDVLPNPHSRVALFLKFGIGNSDYINANYIRGFNGGAKAYIATQGPLPWTVADFWRMVWEQKSTVIIMTTALEERGQVKCAQYWPDTSRRVTSEQYGEIEVTVHRRTTTSSYTMTTFQIKHTERQVVRDVVHYWYTAWPDHGVPDACKEMLEFILASRQTRDNASMPGPVVVHCSAGIGRTGVFIGADMGMRELEQYGRVDVLRILASMRQDRGGMIQTRDQYVFLHKLLYEYARSISARQGSQLDSHRDTGPLSTPGIADPLRREL